MNRYAVPFLEKIRLKLEDFYVKEAYSMINAFQRPLPLCVIFIIIRQYEILQLNFNRNYFTEEINLNINNNEHLTYIILEE